MLDSWDEIENSVIYRVNPDPNSKYNSIDFKSWSSAVSYFKSLGCTIQGMIL